MNRHRAHWSIMGNEPSESTAKSEDMARFKGLLKIMFGKYDSTEVVNAVREVYEEHSKEGTP